MVHPPGRTSAGDRRATRGADGDTRGGVAQPEKRAVILRAGSAFRLAQQYRRVILNSVAVSIQTSALVQPEPGVWTQIPYVRGGGVKGIEAAVAADFHRAAEGLDRLEREAEWAESFKSPEEAQTARAKYQRALGRWTEAQRALEGLQAPPRPGYAGVYEVRLPNVALCGPNGTEEIYGDLLFLNVAEAAYGLRGRRIERRERLYRLHPGRRLPYTYDAGRQQLRPMNGVCLAEVNLLTELAAFIRYPNGQPYTFPLKC